jgi:hypothetical protein
MRRLRVSIVCALIAFPLITLDAQQSPGALTPQLEALLKSI